MHELCPYVLEIVQLHCPPWSFGTTISSASMLAYASSCVCKFSIALCVCVRVPSAYAYIHGIEHRHVHINCIRGEMILRCMCRCGGINVHVCACMYAVHTCVGDQVATNLCKHVSILTLDGGSKTSYGNTKLVQRKHMHALFALEIRLCAYTPH
jgi:hypothetical protein